MLDTRCWISNRTLSVNFNDIQDPETRIQNQSILSRVFISAAKLDFKILCNYRVKNTLIPKSPATASKMMKIIT